MSFFSCQNDIEVTKPEDSKLVSFQTELHQLFETANNNVAKAKTIKELDLGNAIKTSYIQTAEHPDLVAFDKASKTLEVSDQPRSEFANRHINNILNLSKTEDEAIASFDALIKDPAVETKDKFDFVMLRESILFLKNYNTSVKIAKSKNARLASVSPLIEDIIDERPCWKCTLGIMGMGVTGFMTFGIYGPQAAIIGGIAGMMVATATFCHTTKKYYDYRNLTVIEADYLNSLTPTELQKILFIPQLPANITYFSPPIQTLIKSNNTVLR
ncbi:MAG: hypothetical protein KA313_10885 [Pseudarcicella sp.]|nr:hypothetical protein [Pseudarcicella sp.]MBP6411595.1 hypothetical protein [Pseudarcicella sp.]